MTVDPANAHELTQIAGEIGADVLSGALRYPSESGGWQLGDTVPKTTSYRQPRRAQRALMLHALP